MKKWVKITIISVSSVVVVSLAAFFIYVSIYYHATDEALSAMQSDSAVTVTESGGRIIFEPKNAEYGFIFYQGGKVEAKAYAPLMHKLAENNVLCIIVEMPFNLAVFNINGADGIQDDFPQIKHWYIGGHSLGGSMAAVYSSEHADKLDGLVLLAAYSARDISNTKLNVISIYGTNDTVLNAENYKKNLTNLPSDTKQFFIFGGCHSFFGSYGTQRGDGIPTITREEQVSQTVSYLMNQAFVQK